MEHSLDGVALEIADHLLARLTSVQTCVTVMPKRIESVRVEVLKVVNESVTVEVLKVGDEFVTVEVLEVGHNSGDSASDS